MAEEKAEVFRSNAPQEIALAESGDAKRKKSAEGPTELRQVTDHHATGSTGERALADVEIAKHASDALAEIDSVRPADPAIAPVAAAAPAAAPAMINKDDAIPWALSINLEERIKGLGSKTASVNQELDVLEAASQKLAKRIGK